MLSALEYLEKQQIVHCDLKPENILCDHRNNFFLADFGFAVPSNASSFLGGTPMYRAPEVYHNLVDCRNDVWSLGMVGLFLLSLIPRDVDAESEMRLWVVTVCDAAQEAPDEIQEMLEPSLSHRKHAAGITSAVAGRTKNSLSKIRTSDRRNHAQLRAREEYLKRALEIGNEFAVLDPPGLPQMVTRGRTRRSKEARITEMSPPPRRPEPPGRRRHRGGSRQNTGATDMSMDSNLRAYALRPRQGTAATDMSFDLGHGLSSCMQDTPPLSPSHSQRSSQSRSDIGLIEYPSQHPSMHPALHPTQYQAQHPNSHPQPAPQPLRQNPRERTPLPDNSRSPGRRRDKGHDHHGRRDMPTLRARHARSNSGKQPHSPHGVPSSAEGSAEPEASASKIRPIREQLGMQEFEMDTRIGATKAMDQRAVDERERTAVKSPKKERKPSEAKDIPNRPAVRSFTSRKARI